MPLHQVNGQWIHYEDGGGNALPVVLAHGILMDGEMFAPQLALQGPDCRLITWDARCHGETENTVDPFSYWDLAGDLKGLLDHLGIEKAVIGGMSQGGFTALRFALQYPERVSGLILIGTQAGVEDPDTVATYTSMLDSWTAEGLNDKLAETIAAIIIGNEWPGSDHWIKKWRQKAPSLRRQAFQALVGREDIHERLGEIKADTLVIHGSADAAIDVDLAARLCSELANCRELVIVDGAGHACNMTHPQVVNLAIRKFLIDLKARANRGAERRSEARRSNAERRYVERRSPERASAGRRVFYPIDRRTAERRGS